MAPTFKIAVIQLYVKPLRPAENFARAVSFIRDAAAQGCHLAVLPEFHLTNWIPNDPRFAALCADWETYLKQYQALAKECNICIVPGSIVQTIPDGSALPTQPKLENVTYFISNNGEILGSYTKKNLWGPTERKHLRSSGTSPHQVVQTPLGPVGLLVCWDLAFPEAWRELVQQGAKIIIVPTLWTRSGASDAGHRWNPSAESLFLDSVLTARTFENTCAVVFANAGGPPGRNYCGLSQVTIPYAGPLVRLGTSSEGMAVAELDMAVLEDAEANYSIRADMEQADWHYSYARKGKEEPKSNL
ncbi:putative carbon-nitrogen family hydrolase [Aspergillus alliaceus]|uniref:Putative carbon-nitrogen family hydrolase n=1 Tax=Petromyces alliaceus TaxID=209559 RepID=A0A5N7CDR7_PETAA|nr:putative carbon-nitrogen family hydrolase [Aspergillus alliaceus]